MAENHIHSFDLFSVLAPKIEVEMDVFLIGGENMRRRGLKQSQNDYDLVVLNREAFNEVVSKLQETGFRSLNETCLSSHDSLSNVSDRLKHDNYGIVDIFELIIKRDACYISERMKRRASFAQYGKLRLGLLHINDIFLLKAIAAREKDISDIKKIIQVDDFDYKVVYDELKKQEHETRQFVSDRFLFSIDSLAEENISRPTFYRKLLLRVVDRYINTRVRHGRMQLDKLIADLQGGDITTELILKRIEYLVRKKDIRKLQTRDGVFIAPRKRNVLNTPSKQYTDSYESLRATVATIIKSLYLPPEVDPYSESILSRLYNKGLHEGHRSRIVASAVAFLAGRNIGYRYSSAAVARAGGVSNNSLRSYLAKINSQLFLID